MTARPASHAASASSFRFRTTRRPTSVLICRRRGIDPRSPIASNQFSAFTASRVRQAWNTEAIARILSKSSSEAIAAFRRQASKWIAASASSLASADKYASQCPAKSSAEPSSMLHASRSHLLFRRFTGVPLARSIPRAKTLSHLLHLGEFVAIIHSLAPSVYSPFLNRAGASDVSPDKIERKQKPKRSALTEVASPPKRPRHQTTKMLPPTTRLASGAVPK